jgi:hypothetical protein
MAIKKTVPGTPLKRKMGGSPTASSSIADGQATIKRADSRMHQPPKAGSPSKAASGPVKGNVRQSRIGNQK